MLNLDEAVREAIRWEIDKPREEWLFGYPAELALLAGQVPKIVLSFSIVMFNCIVFDGGADEELEDFTFIKKGDNPTFALHTLYPFAFILITGCITDRDKYRERGI